MVYALVLMGVATLCIGLTPSYDSIGVIAPVLLIVFRLLQAISFGAEIGTRSNRRHDRSTAPSGAPVSDLRFRSG
jgi:MFS family permease